MLSYKSSNTNETKIRREFTLENSLSLFITVNEYAADFKYGHLFIREY